MRRRFPLRQPKIPHDPADRLVPYSLCGCHTCEGARADAESAHWGTVGELLGEVDQGVCPCGRSLDVHGICIAWWMCPHSKKPECGGLSRDCDGIATAPVLVGREVVNLCDACQRARGNLEPGDGRAANDPGVEGGVVYDRAWDQR